MAVLQIKFEFEALTPRHLVRHPRADNVNFLAVSELSEIMNNESSQVADK